ncbi:MAG: ABC transporter permease [Methanobrevibacter sp.]|jgi:hypothetical protein|nr:ABC transporter permease [Candidatus Methanovirga australis]
MNFTNIRKICLKELKESLYDHMITQMPLLMVGFLITFIFFSKSNGDILNNGEIMGFSYSIGMPILLIKYRLTDEVSLGKFQSLLSLPMSLKEIFLGKWLAIAILSFFYTVLTIFMFKIASLLLYGTINLDLILIIPFFLLFVIIQIYFAISVLLSLKYKSRTLGLLIRFAPFILSIIAIACGFLYMQRTGLLNNPEFFNSLNQTAQPPNVSNSMNSILLNPLFWLFGMVGLSGIIILILSFTMLYLLNRLNKEKILI